MQNTEKHNYLKRICQKIVVSKLRSCSEVIGASVEDRAEKERVWLESREYLRNIMLGFY